MSEKAPTPIPEKTEEVASEKEVVTLDNLTYENLSDFTPQSHEEEAIAEKVASGHLRSGHDTTEASALPYTVTDRRAGAAVLDDLPKKQVHLDSVWRKRMVDDDGNVTQTRKLVRRAQDVEGIDVDWDAVRRQDKAKARAEARAKAKEEAAAAAATTGTEPEDPTAPTKGRRAKKAETTAKTGSERGKAGTKPATAETGPTSPTAEALKRLVQYFETRATEKFEKDQIKTAEKAAAEEVEWKDKVIRARAYNVNRLKNKDSAVERNERAREAATKFAHSIGDAGLTALGFTIIGFDFIRDKFSKKESDAEKDTSKEKARRRKFGSALLQLYGRGRASVSAATEAAKTTWKTRADLDKTS